ncbi:hypothetical protein [Neobacillus sp. CF12]|uniref:magnesium chelatase subunit ChlI family protein n=1 Tax=Neobacillus sp. CF12 TaxID=3055864 RepID=UPI0025A2338B|nr:hypothetical protein [Neobacillus sp. CF12]MDM5329854.1 hypothetical protein [Neobacillus sp. CF12]
MLTNVAAKQNWSNRVQIKIIRLARSISDLEGEESITNTAIWEAMILRRWGLHKQQSVGGRHNLSYDYQTMETVPVAGICKKINEVKYENRRQGL